MAGCRNHPDTFRERLTRITAVDCAIYVCHCYSLCQRMVHPVLPKHDPPGIPHAAAVVRCSGPSPHTHVRDISDIGNEGSHVAKDPREHRDVGRRVLPVQPTFPDERISEGFYNIIANLICMSLTTKFGFILRWMIQKLGGPVPFATGALNEADHIKRQWFAEIGTTTWLPQSSTKIAMVPQSLYEFLPFMNSRPCLLDRSGPFCLEDVLRFFQRVLCCSQCNVQKKDF